MLKNFNRKEKDTIFLGNVPHFPYLCKRNPVARPNQRAHVNNTITTNTNNRHRIDIKPRSSEKRAGIFVEV